VDGGGQAADEDELDALVDQDAENVQTEGMRIPAS
jgi:hypothetical protein